MPKPIGKLFRLRADRLNKEDEALFCLPLAFRDILLDASERLEWASTWVDNDGNRIALTEQQKTLIEEGIARLTMACEIIVNNQITVPAPVVNVSCSAGGTTVNLPPLTDNQGNVIEVVCLPVDPANPTNEPVDQPFDDGTNTPPDGWTDYPEFVDARCLLANYIVDSFIDFVDQSDRIEQELSAGTVLLDIASILLLLLPLPLGKLKGLATVAKWVSRLAALIAVATSSLESVNDALQLIADEVRSRREKFICAIYSATNEQELVESFTAVFNFWITPLLANTGLTPEEKDGLRGWALEMGQDFARSATSYLLAQEIPASFVASYNCADCAAPSGFDYIPANLDYVYSVGGVNATTNILIASSLINDNAGSRLVVSADAAGRFSVQRLAATLPPVSTEGRYVGYLLDLEISNCNLWVGGGDGNAGGLLNDDAIGFHRTVADGPFRLHMLRGDGASVGYPDIDTASEYVQKYNGVNANSCDQQEQSFGIGGTSLAAGHYSVVITGFKWIRNLGLAC